MNIYHEQMQEICKLRKEVQKWQAAFAGSLLVIMLLVFAWVMFS